MGWKLKKMEGKEEKRKELYYQKSRKKRKQGIAEHGEVISERERERVEEMEGVGRGELLIVL